ncbi:hypothetical protein AT6N2_C0359 [Agrobacterium tumefaciens]|nr:hypothetical protein AT6N2_C0359 [Agrobacterium tumefaciens]
MTPVKIKSIPAYSDLRFFRHAIRRPWRIEGHLDGDAGNTLDGANGVFHPARHFAGDRATGGRQRHDDLDHPVVLDIDLVNETEFEDISRNFRVINGLQRRDHIVAEACELIRRNGGYLFLSFGRILGLCSGIGSHGLKPQS